MVANRRSLRFQSVEVRRGRGSSSLYVCGSRFGVAPCAHQVFDARRKGCRGGCDEEVALVDMDEKPSAEAEAVAVLALPRLSLAEAGSVLRARGSEVTIGRSAVPGCVAAAGPTKLSARRAARTDRRRVWARYYGERRTRRRYAGCWRLSRRGIASHGRRAARSAREKQGQRRWLGGAARGLGFEAWLGYFRRLQGAVEGVDTGGMLAGGVGQTVAAELRDGRGEQAGVVAGSVRRLASSRGQFDHEGCRAAGRRVGKEVAGARREKKSDDAATTAEPRREREAAGAHDAAANNVQRRENVEQRRATVAALPFSPRALAAVAPLPPSPSCRGGESV
ncbi:hypothetical protein [Oryza sativa Japonica Group]|uniref:Uncharacterized protein n=1 Tax=Oryza sativa subsp. japonica TaxID=39947 RepID=Q5NB10_ORYSJ|nr:hypothetical protein [Oryza sativa Japonica Group]BAD86856.1 hypothetical protein [Oryza sativa Japonica Group]